MKKLLATAACCALMAVAVPAMAQTDMMKGDMGKHEMMQMKDHAKDMGKAMMDKAQGQMMAGHTMSFTLKDADMKDVGTVTMEHGAADSLLTVEVHDMTPGWHGFHVHEKGSCSDAFKAAGGHAGMEGQTDGVLSAMNPKIGDLPNVWVGADGTGKAQFFTKMKHDFLNDTDGSAFMLHAGTDDYKDAASSGARVACAVIYPAK